MRNKIKNEFKYKLIGILLYFIFSLGGLSLLFIFKPRELLFTENDKDKTRQILFRDFVKIAYENINKPLIKNMTVIRGNEDCKEPDFEKLVITNQYLGNFTKFYGNNSFCIQRIRDEQYKYERLLTNLEDQSECERQGKVNCGFLNLYYAKEGKVICFNNKSDCPLGEFDFFHKGDEYQSLSGKSYLKTYFGDRKSDYSIVVNIEIINNSRFCLEKFFIKKEEECEFPDNNACFIHVGFKLIQNIDLDEEYELIPGNLAKWNLVNDYNINHQFCNKKSSFQIMHVGYFNFTYENLLDFKREFPPETITNNPLYNTIKAYKTKNNSELLFNFISLILLCFSITQFIFQILVYINKKEIRIYYIISGIILFFLKLFAFLGMIIYHFLFYLKIRKTYVILIDESLKKLLQEYTSTRKIFITKMFLFWLSGFLIIVVDLIILFFTINIKWGLYLEIKKEDKMSDINSAINKNNNRGQDNIFTIDDNTEDLDNYLPTRLKTSLNIMKPIKNENDDKKYINTKIDNQNEFNEAPPINNQDKIDEMNLQFLFKDDLSQKYEIKCGKNESFNKVIERLKEENDLKDKNMKVFSYKSTIINKDKNVEENGLKDQDKIVIMT